MRKIKWGSLAWAVWFLIIYSIPTPAGREWIDWLMLASAAFHVGSFLWSFRRHPTVECSDAK